MDKRRTKQLLGLSRDVISTTVIVFTDHCVMRCITASAVDADPLRKRRLLSIFFVKVRLLLGIDVDYLALARLAQLSSIDIKDMASYIGLFGLVFQRGVIVL